MERMYVAETEGSICPSQRLIEPSSLLFLLDQKQKQDCRIFWFQMLFQNKQWNKADLWTSDGEQP